MQVMNMAEKIILASGSPRRRQLLDMAGFDFEVIPANVDESADPLLGPEELVAALSEKKALALDIKNAVIIGADTVVAIDGLILGKPKDEEDAYNMLSRLQGRMHVVYTGVTVVAAAKSSTDIKTFVESTKVFMRPLTEGEIHAYISTGEPLDKAGAYGIQERGAVLIERIEGDYFTVVGLPLCRLNKLLLSMR